MWIEYEKKPYKTSPNGILDEEMVEEKCDRKSHFSSFRLCYKTTTAIENAALRSVVAEFFLVISFRFIFGGVQAHRWITKQIKNPRHEMLSHALQCYKSQMK